MEQREPLPDECISHYDMVRALNIPLSESEHSILEYLAGFFFRKLLQFHSVKKVAKSCSTCGVHGHKITSTSVLEQKSDLFLFIKRYNTDTATLYKCSSHFVHLIQVIIQVANFFVEHLLDQPRIVNMIRLSIREHLANFPQFCTDAKFDRLVSYVARTIVVYRAKWLNNDLRALKKAKKGRGRKSKSKSDKKLEKLMHM